MRWIFIAYFAAVAAVFAIWQVSEARIGVARFAGGNGPPPPITSVTFGTPFFYSSNYPSKYVFGDTWFSTWADDNNNYVTSNDVFPWNATVQQNDIRLNTLTNFSTSTTGTEVQATTSFNEWGQTFPGSGTDNANFKSNGIISISGTFYMNVHRYVESTVNHFNGTLVKSANHGASWTPSSGNSGGSNNPYSSVMFSGATFPQAFVQYGQNYLGSGPDQSGTYVYCTSNTLGTSPNFLQLYLARVPLALIGNLSAGDWQWWQGGGTWGALGTAVPIIDTTGAGGPGIYSGSMQYLPRYGQYLYIGNSSSAPSSFDAFVGNHPWGPFTLMAQFNTTPYTGMYFPAIAPGSLTSGGQTLVVLGSANGNNMRNATDLYSMAIQTVTMTP